MEILENFFIKTRDLFYYFLGICRLITFDHEKIKIFLRIEIKSFLLQFSLGKPSFNSWFISTLSAKEACQLGECYGRSLKALRRGNKIAIKTWGRNIHDIVLKNKKGVFQIMCWRRDRGIEYMHKESKKLFCQFPDEIIKNEYLISNFDPTQAYYIGILSGKAAAVMNIERSENTDYQPAQNKKLPVLYIVK